MDTAPRTNGPAPDHRLARGLAVALALLVFAALLTWRLGEREFWLDEQITVGHLGDAQPRVDPFHPPGYYRLLFLWRAAFGASDGVLRGFSVVCALLGAVLAWLLARELLPAPWEVLALWLYVLSPLNLLYFRMARYFSLTAAVALAAAYLALLVRRKGTPLCYVGLALAAMALLWVDFLPLLLLALVYLWLLPTAWRRGRERYWWLGAAALPLAVAAWQGQELLSHAGSVAAIPAASSGARLLAMKLALPFYSALVGETTDFWRLGVVAPVLIAGLMLAVVGLVAAARTRDDQRWPRLLGWPLAVVLAAALLSSVAASEPWPRVSSLCLYTLPFFLVWLALGVRALRRCGWVLLAIVVGGQIYGLGNYLSQRQFLNPGYNLPWREVNTLVQSRGRAGDVAMAYFDSTAARYWSGPVPFLDTTEQAVPPDLPGVRDFPPSGRPPDTGHDVWVMDRERGSALARDLTEQLVAWLRPRARSVEVYRFMPYSPEERRWRSRLQELPAGEAYLTVWRFRGR